MDNKTISKIKEINPNLTKEEKISEIKRIVEEKNEPELVIIKDIKEVLTKLANILGVVSNIENKDVKTYEEELQTLVDSISELKETITDKDMVVNIPLDDLASSISRVENAVKSIKFPEINIPETVVNEVSFKDDEIIDAIKNIPQFPIEDIKKMFSGITEMLSGTPEFNYERLERKLDGVIKAIGKIDLSVYGGGGNSYVRNAKSEIVNPATEEKQNTQITNQETIIDDIDEVETLLSDIKSNQTNLTQKTQIFDSWGDEIGSTMIDEMMVSIKSRIAGGVFNGTTPDTNFYTTVLSANATATISNGVLDLATTTDANSSSLIYTNTIGRYIGGSMNHLRGIFRVGDTGVANNTRQIGCTALANLADSFYFQLSGTTFSIVANTTGLAQIKIDNGSFNGDQSSYTLTDTFYTWEILFTNKRIQFYIDKFLVHTFTQTTFPICGTRHLRPFMRNVNSGVGSVAHLYTQVLSMLTWGETHTQSKSHYHEGQTAGVLLKNGIGSIHSIVISGVTNTANVDIYNGINATGTKIWSSGSMSNQTIPLTVTFNTGEQFNTGLFLVKNGANCNTKLFYE